jgi:hypothetical protein
MKRSEYERLKKQIEDDYRRKLDALEVVWQLVAPSGKPSENGDRSERTTQFATIIGDLIDRLPEQFTVKDVEAHLEKTQGSPVNRSTVSHTLKRMSVDKQRIRVGQVGTGKRATIYEKVGRQNDAMVDEIRELVQAQKLDIGRFKVEVLRNTYEVDLVRQLSDEQAVELRGQLVSGALAYLAAPLHVHRTANGSGQPQ